MAAIPAVHVDQVLIFGNVVLTTPALAFLLEQGISTVFLTLDGRYKGRREGPMGGNAALRLLQYRRASDPPYALEVARTIVEAKLHNMRTLLRRYARRLGTAELAGSDPGRPLTAVAKQLSDLLLQAGRSRSVHPPASHLRPRLCRPPRADPAQQRGQRPPHHGFPDLRRAKVRHPGEGMYRTAVRVHDRAYQPPGRPRAGVPL